METSAMQCREAEKSRLAQKNINIYFNCYMFYDESGKEHIPRYLYIQS